MLNRLVKNQYSCISTKPLANPVRAFTAKKNSKFLAYAFEVNNEDEIKMHLTVLKKEHSKAVHHCYAYRLGLNKNNYRANDDGEPSGSAGRPILGQIDSAELTNTLIVVVRYYGGKKLGVSGLITAYKKSAQDAINNAEIIEREVTKVHTIITQYSKVNDLQHFLNQNKIVIKKQDFTESCYFEILIPDSKEEKVVSWLKSKEYEIV